jgi:peptidoglycan/xylan/chitin deacetylase (PgdA/CDA1 family)
MSRHLVCLTFDFDVVSSWIFRGLTTPTQISRGEFGLFGAERILRLLAETGILSTWFVPGHTIDHYPEVCARVHAAGHEIGHHGYLHEPPATLATREREEQVIVQGNDAIRRLTGSVAVGYRSPSWDLSEHTVDLLLSHGFTYDSSMMADDHHPYYARRGDVFSADRPLVRGPSTSLVEVPVSWTLDDFPHFEYRRFDNQLQEGLRRAGDVLDNFVDDFRYMKKIEEWGVLTYTFHPQVVGRGHRMLLLERLIETLRTEGAIFVRMDEAVREFRARSACASAASSSP